VQVTNKAKSIFGSAMSKAKEIDQKHNISGKTATGVTAGMNKLSSLMAPRKSAEPVAAAAAGTEQK
jgi:hypothetical protein